MKYMLKGPCNILAALHSCLVRSSSTLGGGMALFCPHRRHAPLGFPGRDRLGRTRRFGANSGDVFLARQCSSFTAIPAVSSQRFWVLFTATLGSLRSCIRFVSMAGARLFCRLSGGAHRHKLGRPARTVGGELRPARGAGGGTRRGRGRGGSGVGQFRLQELQRHRHLPGGQLPLHGPRRLRHSLQVVGKTWTAQKMRLNSEKE